MDERLALGAGAADGQLLERSAVTAHGVALEVRKDKHAVIVHDVLGDVVFLEHLAVRDGPDEVRSLYVHEVNGEVPVPAVLLYELEVGVRVVAHARAGVAVGGVRLADRAAYLVYHGLPELGRHVVLVALLAGVDLNGDLAGQLYAEGIVHLHDRLAREFAGEIYL